MQKNGSSTPKDRMTTSRSADFQLTRFEAALLQSILHTRLSSWTDQLANTQRVLLDRAQQERSRQPQPINDLSSTMQYLAESALRMFTLVDEIRASIPTDETTLDIRHMQKILTKHKTSAQQARQHALQCGEDARKAPRRLFEQNMTIIARKQRFIRSEDPTSTSDMVNRLASPVRPLALEIIAKARQLREFETQHGARSEHSVEAYACFMVYHGWQAYQQKQQLRGNDGLDPPREPPILPESETVPIPAKAKSPAPDQQSGSKKSNSDSEDLYG